MFRQYNLLKNGKREIQLAEAGGSAVLIFILYSLFTFRRDFDSCLRAANYHKTYGPSLAGQTTQSTSF